MSQPSESNEPSEPSQASQPSELAQPRQHPSRTSGLVHNKAEHLSILKALFQNALLEGRVEVAQRIYQYMARTRIANTEPRFILRAGTELHWHRKNFDIGFLHFLQSCKVQCPDQALLIMQESTNYHVKHGMIKEAYENLLGYMSTAPFSKSPHLHAYCGWLADQLAQTDAREKIREKFERKALSHYDRYLKLVQYRGIELLFLRSHIALLKRTLDFEQAKLILERIVERNEMFVAIHIDLADLLIEHFSTDRPLIYECIRTLSRTAQRVGVPIPSQVCLYVTEQLKNTEIGLPEYTQYLILHTHIICQRIYRTPEPLSEELETSLEICKFQFRWLALFSEWQEIEDAYPRATKILEPPNKNP